MGLPKDCGLELHHKWKSGKLNKITDVKGLKVASVTIQDNEINTPFPASASSAVSYTHLTLPTNREV